MHATTAKHTQPGRIAFLALGSVLLFPPLLSAEESDAEIIPRTLEVDADKHISATHSADQSFTYIYQLEKDTRYLVLVEQNHLDFVLEIEAPDGSKSVFDSPLYRDGQEVAVINTTLLGKYRVQVSPKDNTNALGSHSILVKTLSDLDNQSVITAWSAMSAGANLNAAANNAAWKDALVEYEAAAKDWNSLGRRMEQAQSLYSIATIEYWFMSGWNRSEKYSAKTSALYRSIGEHRLSANALLLQASAIIEEANESSSSSASESFNSAQQKFAVARRVFDKSLQIHQQFGNKYEEALVTNYLGLMSYYMGNWSEARSYYESAAHQFRALGEWSEELNPIANIGVIDFEQGNLSLATASYNRLLSNISAEHEPAWRADTLDNLGAAQLALGQFDGALSSFSSALDLHEQLDSTKGKGRSLTGIASTYYSIGETDLAKETFERALSLRQEANDGRGQIAVLHFLGDIHRQLGQFDQAIQYHEEALKLTITPVARAKIEILLARDWIGDGNYLKAEQLLESALSATESTNAAAVIADTHFELGRVASRRDNYDATKARLTKAESLYASLGLLDGMARSKLELAKIVATNDIDSAIDLGLQAIAHIESLRSRVSSPERRAVYLSTRRDYYEFLISTYMRASDTAPNDFAAEEFLRRAVTAAERARARATVDLMSEAAVELRQGENTELKDRQQAHYERLAELQYQRDVLIDSDASPSELDPIVSELQDLYAEIDVLEINLRRTNPKLSVLRNPAVLDTRDLQDQLDAESAVLQYWIGDRESYLWVVTKNELHGVQLPDKQAVEDFARKAYESLSVAGITRAQSIELDSIINSLSDLIIGPIKETIRDKSRIFVAADGALQYIPFSLLTLDNGKSLVDSHEVVNIPSTTAIATQRLAFANRKSPTKTLALFGDPVFDSQDPRLLDQFAMTNPRPTKGAKQGSMSILNQGRFQRLPFSAPEIENIADMVPAQNRLVATGFDANKENILGSALENYRYVHFATHGLINATNPSMSTLVFSLRDQQGAPQNGFLRLHDIYNMKLNADIVVLSACETGLGREIRGEGLVGLTQGFMYAGAKGVVASLWPVSDRATAELMKRFYQNLIEGKHKPASALRTAQLDLASDRRWQNPYYWGGFVLHGDWI